MKRVLPVESTLVQKVLLDFRQEEDGARYIVRMKGEGRYRSSVFPEFNETGRRVLLEYIPYSEWNPPALLLRWLHAARLPYLLFSILPLLLVASRYFSLFGSLPVAECALLFASVMLIHTSSNLWSDYEDHLRGVDAPEHSGGSGVIQKLWIPALQLKRAAMALFGLGAIFGLSLLFVLPMDVVGIHLLWLGLAGALGAASYSGWPFHYKYIGLGEPIVFLLSGPVVSMGASLVIFREPGHFLYFSLASLPLAFLAILRLHGGNMQRIPFDSMAGVFTIARFLGFFWSKIAFAFLLFAPFFAAMALWFAGLTPHTTVAAGAALPFVLFAYMPLKDARGPLDPDCQEFRRQAARLHIVFGLIYSLSFIAR